MKNDYIPFQVQPVAGYTDLFSANDRLVQNNHDVLSSPIKLYWRSSWKQLYSWTWGALTSILPIFYPPTSPEELHSEPRSDLNFYIIDSHRPWDLNNVFMEEGGVYCVDDGDIESGLAIGRWCRRRLRSLAWRIAIIFGIWLRIGGPKLWSRWWRGIAWEWADDEYDSNTNVNGKRGRSRRGQDLVPHPNSEDGETLTENDTTDDESDSPASPSPERVHHL